MLTDRKFLEHDPGAGHPESPARLEAVLAIWTEPRSRASISERRGPRPTRRSRPSIPRGTATALAGLAGQRARLDPDTIMSPDSWDAATLAAGAAVGAVEAVMAGPRRATRSRWCGRPGTTPSPTARWASACSTTPRSPPRRRGARGAERVLIVDWDVHHGNGTQDIFAARPDVLYMSVHQFPFYPGTGAADEVGVGAGRGATVNCPLPGGQTDADYGAVFHDLFLPAARRFAPDVVIVSAGFDAHARDPLARDARHRARLRGDGVGAAPSWRRRPVRRQAGRCCSRAATTCRRWPASVRATLEVLTGRRDDFPAGAGAGPATVAAVSAARAALARGRPRRCRET